MGCLENRTDGGRPCGRCIERLLDVSLHGLAACDFGLCREKLLALKHPRVEAQGLVAVRGQPVNGCQRPRGRLPFVNRLLRDR